MNDRYRYEATLLRPHQNGVTWLKLLCISTHGYGSFRNVAVRNLPVRNQPKAVRLLRALAAGLQRAQFWSSSAGRRFRKRTPARHSQVVRVGPSSLYAGDWEND